MSLFKNIGKVLLIGVWSLSCTQEAEKSSSQGDSSTVFERGEKVSNDNFTGNVWLNMLVAGDTINPTSVGSVTFEKGARTNWHSHPAGQIILALAGEGYYQEKGKPKRVVKKGEVVTCPPNIPHWHGASKDSSFVQVAITGREKGPTQWLESVTDNDYHKESN
jgi:quercetin dioxygenase-like cupin family protein